jgi:hypothetical protein
MTSRDAVLTAAQATVDADTAEEGLAEIRALAGTEFSDAELAAAVAAAVREGLVRDPVRLLPGALQCRWRLELAPGADAGASW